MGSNRGVIGPIWRKKWCGWCGKPFGIISEHNFFLEKIHFLPPSPNFFKFRRHANSYRGPSQNLSVSYLEIYVELRDLPPWTFFSYVMVLNPNPLSDGPDRTIYPGFQIPHIMAQWVLQWLPVEIAWGPHEGGTCRCYTIVSISRPGTHAIVSAHIINPTNGSTFRTWDDVCQKLFNEEGHSACLLAASNWGPTTNANISAQNTKTPSHVRYCVYMPSGYLSYHTLTPAWADLYIGELENRPQKDMHITIRYIYIYIYKRGLASLRLRRWSS